MCNAVCILYKGEKHLRTVRNFVIYKMFKGHCCCVMEIVLYKRLYFKMADFKVRFKNSALVTMF